MPTARIFVSYAIAGDERGAEVAHQLLDDLRDRGAEVVTDDGTIADEDFIAYLDRELPRCQYFILVQTAVARKSLRVQTSLSVAFKLAAQQRLRGVFRLAAVPLEKEDWV